MTYESIQPILDWIAANPTWSGFVVFLISLSESLAIVGLVVPGVVMMTAIGAMMGGGVLPFWETLTWAILGAIAGDGISYWLGYHYHERLRKFWPFKQFPELLARGETFFKNHGGKSIIFGRFVGPVRPMIPVIAGMMDMKPGRFLFFNIISAIAWAPLYSLPGILIGVSLGTLSPEVGKRIVLLILFLLLVLWLVYIVLIKIGSWIGAFFMKFLNRLWLSVSASPRLRWLHQLLSTAQGSEETQFGILILGLFASLCFCIVTLNVINLNGIASLNEPIHQLFRALHQNNLIDWLTFLTAIGDTTLLTITTLVIVIFLFWRKRYMAAACWFFTYFVGTGIAFVIRQWVAMPRPEGLIYLSHQYSYPSGHSISTTIVYGLAAAFISPMLEPKHRYLPWAIAIPVILFVPLSRVYLGIHWFTDMLGGILLGIASVSFGIFIYRRYESKLPRVRSILIPGLCVLILGLTYYGWQVYPEKRKEFSRHWTVKEFNSSSWWNNEASLDYLQRTGTIRKTSVIFNLQWLGSLDEIQSILEKQGFRLLPKLTLQSSLTFLETNPGPNIPVLPKFHRDRLPVLVFSKALNPKERLVIQLWQSDFINEIGIPLWVGTLRVESEHHPLPLINLYLENELQNKILMHLTEGFASSPNLTYRILPASQNSETEILLIKGKS